MKIEIVKPIVPQFIAEWIEKEKKNTTFHKSFARAINMIKQDDEWKNWEYKVGNRWSKLLATAWVHGYEVEQEPLYYAKIKGWEAIKDPCKYWNKIKYSTSPMISELVIYKNTETANYLSKMTIERWNKAGINDTNADFEEVKD